MYLKWLYECDIWRENMALSVLYLLIISIGSSQEFPRICKFKLLCYRIDINANYSKYICACSSLYLMSFTAFRYDICLKLQLHGSTPCFVKINHLFSTITLAFFAGFCTFCTVGDRNEYSTKHFFNLTMSPLYVVKLKIGLA